jgi:hypothetical protein
MPAELDQRARRQTSLLEGVDDGFDHGRKRVGTGGRAAAMPGKIAIAATD